MCRSFRRLQKGGVFPTFPLQRTNRAKCGKPVHARKAAKTRCGKPPAKPNRASRKRLSSLGIRHLSRPQIGGKLKPLFDRGAMKRSNPRHFLNRKRTRTNQIKLSLMCQTFKTGKTAMMTSNFAAGSGSLIAINYVGAYQIGPVADRAFPISEVL